jgi:nucleoid DNA-binding protein
MRNVNYTRECLARDISNGANISVVQAKQAIASALEGIEKSLMSGVKVEIRGFGILLPITKGARKGRNPRKPQEECLIPARKGIKFKIGTDLDSKLNPV